MVCCTVFMSISLKEISLLLFGALVRAMARSRVPVRVAMTSDAGTARIKIDAKAGHPTA